MSPRSVIAWELAVVLLLALVLTVEWWRAGELEDMGRRVDELETDLRLRRTRRKPAASKPDEVKP